MIDLYSYIKLNKFDILESKDFYHIKRSVRYFFDMELIDLKNMNINNIIELIILFIKKESSCLAVDLLYELRNKKITKDMVDIMVYLKKEIEDIEKEINHTEKDKNVDLILLNINDIMKVGGKNEEV